MNIILSLTILSFFFHNIVGYLKFKNLVNPISLFSIIHFLHNWSFSFSRYFSDLLLWNAFPSVSYETIDIILKVNLVGSWTFFLIIVFFAKTQNSSKKYSISNSSALKKIYYFFSTFYVLRVLSTFSLTNYGGDQAITSVEAFNPIQTLIFLRVVAIMLYISLNEVRRKTLFKVIFIELLISIIAFDRKDFIFVIMTIVIKQLQRKFSIKNFGRYFMYSTAIVFMVIFVPQFRVAEGQSTLDSIVLSLIAINDFGREILFYGMNLANSEGVQNWTYQLIESGDLIYLNGKSYFQALVNMFLLRPFQGSIADFQAAYYFKQAAYPDVTSTGFDFSFTAEAILNFGTSFSFISFAILGFIVSYFYSKRLKNDLLFANYNMIWPILLISFRTDSTAMFRVYSYVFLFYLYFKIFKKIKITKNE